MDADAERRVYNLYADTDKARLAAEKKAKEWRAIADALAMVLRKNGVGGRQYNSALDLYDEAVASASKAEPKCEQACAHGQPCSCDNLGGPKA